MSTELFITNTIRIDNRRHTGFKHSTSRYMKHETIIASPVLVLGIMGIYTYLCCSPLHDVPVYVYLYSQSLHCSVDRTSHRLYAISMPYHFPVIECIWCCWSGYLVVPADHGRLCGGLHRMHRLRGNTGRRSIGERGGPAGSVSGPIPVPDPDQGHPGPVSSNDNVQHI